MEYVCIFPGSCSKINLQKLKLFQNLCLRITLRTFRSTPIISLFKYLHPIFSHRIQKLSMQFLLKAVSLSPLPSLLVDLIEILVLALYIISNSNVSKPDFFLVETNFWFRIKYPFYEIRFLHRIRNFNCFFSTNIWTLCDCFFRHENKEQILTPEI